MKTQGRQNASIQSHKKDRSGAEATRDGEAFWEELLILAGIEPASPRIIRWGVLTIAPQCLIIYSFATYIYIFFDFFFLFCAEWDSNPRGNASRS